MHQGPPRILIVRPSALGDVARTVPLLASLRRAYPDARIDWLVNEPFADAVRHHPALDAVVLFRRELLGSLVWSPRAMREGLRLRKQLRAARYDLVLDAQGLLRSGLLTRLTGSPRRLGLADAREGGRFAYTERVPVPANVVHTVDRTLQLVHALGVPPVRDMGLHIGAEDQQWLDAYLAEHQLVPGGYACLAPTARWGCKCWPIEHYTTLARRLLIERIAGEHLVILAGPDERQVIQPMLKNLMHTRRKGDVPVTDRVVAPTTTVGQMMALLSQSSLLVANDSAALHIAVGFDRPVVAVFGPTDPASVGPYRRADAVVQPPNVQRDQLDDYRSHLNDDSLIRTIPVEAVWAKVLQVLGQPHRALPSR